MVIVLMYSRYPTIIVLEYFRRNDTHMWMYAIYVFPSVNSIPSFNRKL